MKMKRLGIICLKNYSEAYPELAEEFKLAMSGKLPNNYADAFTRI